MTAGYLYSPAADIPPISRWKILHREASSQQPCGNRPRLLLQKARPRRRSHRFNLLPRPILTAFSMSDCQILQDRAPAGVARVSIRVAAAAIRVPGRRPRWPERTNAPRPREIFSILQEFKRGGKRGMHHCGWGVLICFVRSAWGDAVESPTSQQRTMIRAMSRDGFVICVLGLTWGSSSACA